MELRHLRYLVAIADAGTFVRAAEQLRVAQPALTRQIHDLEKELGAELFDAQARKATLTAAGDVCVRLARHVMQDTDRAVARARLSNSGVVGRCVLGCGPLPLLAGIGTGFVARMRSRYPGITLEVKEINSGEQWLELERAEVDVGLGITPPASFANLSHETQFMHVIDHLIVAPNHALAGKASVTLKELRGHPQLGMEDASVDLKQVREATAEAMKALGFPSSALRPRAFSTYESLLSHVRAGQGWALMPSAVAGRVPGCVTVPITDLRLPFKTVRIWRHSDTRPVIQTVLRELRALQHDPVAQLPMAVDASLTGKAAVDEFVPARLDLRHLRSFAAVAKYGSLGRAAEYMEVTQPALSRQMRELEYDVGVPLLDRKTRGMHLTAAGEEFIGDVKGVLSIVDHVPREVRRAMRGTAQRCVIGAVPHPYVERVIARATADLENRGARVRVGTRSISTPLQAEALRQGEIDIAMGHTYPVPAPMGMDRDLIVAKLFEDRIATALVSTTHPLAASASLRVRDFADVPFLWPRRDLFPRFYDTVFQQLAGAGLRPRVDGEYDGLATMWTLVAHGTGWTLGWESHRHEPPPGCCAIPLQDFSMEWGGELLYRHDESRAPILATIDALIHHARELHHVIDPAVAILPAANTSEAVIS
jgi:DNA-binding transcriptional LysR family regulator